eukprot:TRINITY_DN50762_c0_g1_i1.p1 TRINITY_DN50762_c0_g1~~TRINITY_DN50762_c0_g1_i1.p1  ORF type:complete len:427 (+),score=142.61 TRINITY_DN50762_c0_g1_i1:82-1281(+)
MPAKGKKKDKDKKEEKKEPEQEPVLPDGKKTHVVGGWSALRSIGDALQRAEPGDRVLVHALDPAAGTAYEEQVTVTRDIPVVGAGVGNDPLVIEAPRLATLGASLGATLAGCTVEAVNDQEGVTLAHAAGVQKGWVITALDGALTRGDPEKLAAAWAKSLRSVSVTLRRYVGPDKRPVIGGGLVSTAPAASLANLVIKGGVQLREGALSATGCTLSHAPNLLTLWPWTKPDVRGCKFRGASKACVYCYPHSMGVVEACEMTGDPKAGSCALFIDNGNTKFVGNTIKGHTTGVYVTCDAEADKGRLERPEIKANEIADISGTGIHLDRCCDANCRKNTVRQCAYWGVTVSGGARGTLSNNVVDSKVRIMQGCRPQLVANRISARVVDYNDQGTRALEPHY